MDESLEYLKELLRRGVCCAEAIVRAGLSLRDGQDEAGSDDFALAARGLCGGLYSGLNCGALSSACCLLTLLISNDAYLALPRLCEWFVKAYGTVDCSVICKEVGRARCMSIVIETYEQVLSLLEEFDYDYN